MTMISTMPAAPAAPAKLVDLALRIFGMIPHSLIALVARLSIASVFWASARTKVVEGTWFTLSDNAVYLFREEYRLPLIPPEIAAHLALFNEHVMPILLVVGLASRFAALILLGMTLVIQIFVYPDAYSVHGPWSVCLLYIMARGPGMFSLDHLIGRRIRPATSGDARR
jgi:putative oxidoreductase